MKAIDVVNAVVNWAREHDIAAAILGGLLVGFLLGKVL